jgi:hypothetical protein
MIFNSSINVYMKKILFSLLFAAMAFGANAQEVVNGVRVPSGYQGHIEYSNLFYVDGSNTAMDLSTTHGFYYTPNMFVGLGIGFHGAPGDVYLPIYAAAKYIFNYRTKVSPTVQMKMGSFFNDGAKPYGDLSFGFRFASDRDFAFSIQACGSFYAPFNVTETEWDYVNDKYITTTERRNLSSVGLRLGIEW